MVRKLKYHEQKLLKRTDFISWKSDNTKENLVIRRYQLRQREDYSRYNNLVGLVRSAANKIKELDPTDVFRHDSTRALLEKLYSAGLITNKEAGLIECDRVSVSAICRRRLPVVMMRFHMAQTVSDATKFIEDGHVRVGPTVVTDPAFLVTRSMEDFITWTDTSKIRQKVLEYNDVRDDFDVLGC